MLSPNDSIFKYEDWLSNHKEEPWYYYYSEVTKNHKNLLSAMWTPYFEEIRQRTKVIQDKLKKEWYEDIDLQLKSLFIDWIEFFLSLNTDESQLDNEKWLYLKWLFDSLMINTENKNLLKKILSELKEWWEKLPKSPIDFLKDYEERRPVKEKVSKEAKDPRGILIGPNDLFFPISKEEKEERNAKARDFYQRIRSRDWRLEWKTIMPWHCALDDSPRNLELFWEDVVIYFVWDEYIPWSNHWNSIELLEKVRSSNYDDLKKMYIEKEGKGWRSFLNVLEERWDSHKSIINRIKKTLLNEFPNIIWMYINWDRFEVVKGTYNDKEINEHGRVSCWYVNIRSKKTWKVYRVLSD